MQIEKDKFLVIVYGGQIKYENDIFQVVLEKNITSTWKKALKLKEKFEKRFLKSSYPEREIVIKEKFRTGWEVVATKN